jgi:hypothetical protein
MALLSESDLKYTYSETPIPADDPKATGEPDSMLLNRNELYEVLPFLNHMAVQQGWTTKTEGLKAERMLRQHVPSDQRSRAHVKKWIVDNWSSY